MIHVFTDRFLGLLLKSYNGSRPFEGRLPLLPKDLTTFEKLSNLLVNKSKYIALFLISWQSFAQDFTFKYDNSLKIIQNGQVLSNAFAGGLNAPQFSTCKLDNDGVEDLVVFDRTAQKISTFLAKQDNAGKYFWQYAPQYETAFPKISNWILLIDYNRDGKKDIFAYTPSGIKVFRNTTTDKLAFQLVADPVYSTGFSGKINLYVNATDIPAIVDIDNDGDYDIVVFDSSGNFTFYHRNFSIENYKNANILEFRRVGDCWGGFYKEHFDDMVFNQECGNNPVPLDDPFKTQKTSKVLHAGNSILLLDLNGDGLKDILYGHITKNKVASILNVGTLNQAKFNSADYNFPNKYPIDFSVFPAIFSEDLDFDGVKDLVASPNGYDNAQQTVDYQKSAWFYKNKGQNDKPDFNFVQTNFLQNTMVDLGENSSPAFVDIDGDGDQDLLIGNAGIRGETGYRASIYLYENKGNSTFELVNSDYLAIAKNQQLFEIKPFVSDLNADGVDDFGFISNSFTGVNIRYFPNRAARGKAFDLKLAEVVILPEIKNLSNGDSPLFFDLNKDGLKDLILGKGNGGLAFHKNTGTKEKPVYLPENEELGGIISDYISGGITLTAADLNGDGKEELITGGRDGYLRIYKNLIDQNQTKFVADSSLIFDEFINKNSKVQVGGGLSVAVANLDNDFAPDLLVGTNTGGLKILKNTSKFIITSTEEPINALVYPNPTSKYVYIKNTYTADYEILNQLGLVLQMQKNQKPNQETVFDLGLQNDGIYFLRITAEGKEPQVKKIVLKK
jgi:Secretion system C-terminal sorting domain/FG-GAP-like repeat